MSFSGHGCAISQASTSIMIDTLKGKSIKEAKEIINVYLKMIRRESISKEESKLLKDAIAFKNISNMPARVKCALLAWHTLDDMIKENNR
jgi:nitrogen fixation NifU-like protein